jgi:hypothetical protein
MDQTAFADLEQRLARLEGEFQRLRDLVHQGEPDDGRQEEPSSDPPAAPEPVDAPGPAMNGNGSSPASANGTPAPAADPIVAWFAKSGIAVEVEEETEADRVFDRLAEYLGDHFPDLHRLAGGIRWTILENETTAFALKKLAPSEREHFLEFARMLNDLAFLSDFHYNETAERLKFQARDDQRLLRFISGQWLERYVLVKGRKCFEKASVEFASARNIEVKAGASNPRFEMDVLFLVGGNPIWIECKSREFRRDIGKYAERAELLGIPLDRTVVAVQSFEDERTEEAAADIPRLYGLSVNDTKGLERRFEEIASAEPHAAGAEVGAEDDPASLSSALSAYLAQSQLSPHPDNRERLLAALLEAAGEGLPATTGELRDRMRARVPASLAPAAHPVLVAVRRGGGLLGESGEPRLETALNTEVAGLAANDVAGLEALCLNAYEEAIRRKMPQVAGRTDFEALLSSVVGGTPPA